MEPKPSKPERPGSAGPSPADIAARKASSLELVALLFLSLATVGTAWCSYQAAVWGGVSQRTMNMSAAASRSAAVDQLQAYQVALVDVLLFSQHINARGTSNEALARFYADRFRAEAKTAFEAWMAMKPFVNANAPPHPFVTNLYKPRLLEQARLAESKGQQFWQQAGEAGRTGRSYVLVTVLLASALFCGGTASKFETLWIRRTVLALGLGTVIFAGVRLFSLPIKL